MRWFRQRIEETLMFQKNYISFWFINNSDVNNNKKFSIICSLRNQLFLQTENFLRHGLFTKFIGKGNLHRKRRTHGFAFILIFALNSRKFKLYGSTKTCLFSRNEMQNKYWWLYYAAYCSNKLRLAEMIKFIFEWAVLELQILKNHQRLSEKNYEKISVGTKSIN